MYVVLHFFLRFHTGRFAQPQSLPVLPTLYKKTGGRYAELTVEAGPCTYGPTVPTGLQNILGGAVISQRFWFRILAAVLLLGGCFTARGQSTSGSISGTVKDASGAAVSGAQVALTSTTTGAKETFTTDENGLYSFVNVNPGEYTVDVDKTGFKRFKRASIDLQVQQSVRIDATLEVGAESQTVEVTAETPLLQTDNASLGQVIDERKTNETPLNGRNVFNLITLSPAAIAQGGAGSSQVGQNPFSWGNYQVGGSFGNQSAEYVDGQPVNIGYINLPVLIPDQDAISEFKVQYNNLGPEWGRFSGGIVNLSTKGGSNKFHGEAYEYLRNKVLNSRPYFPEGGRILPTCRISSAARLAARLSKTRRFSSLPMMGTVSGHPRFLLPRCPRLGRGAAHFPRTLQFTIL
jgi:hypothetical protein